MSELQKATLQAVSSDENESPQGDAVAVQFNPSSLKLKLTNSSEGGRSRARQRRQQTGQSSNVLSMDLIFDSADEGTADAPESVRKKTAIVEKFVVPEQNNPDPPPRLKFVWNELAFTGIVESVDINFEHFAENGAPLRAKMSISIKEQDPKYQFLQSGPGARNSDNAAPQGQGNNASNPGGGTNDPTSNNENNSDRSATALDGESPAEFAARQGLDPAAWRGLDVDLSAGLSLEAGLEVGFSAGLSASVGIGISAGIQVEAGVSLEASLGVDVSASVGASASVSAAGTSKVGASASGSASSGSKVQSSNLERIDGDKAGLALSAAGGIEAAIENVKVTQANSAAESARASFDLASPTASSGASSSAISTSANLTSSATMPAITRTPLSSSESTTSTSSDSATQSEQSQTSLLPIADKRSQSFGIGVPLRPLYASAIRQQQVKICQEFSSLSFSGPPITDNPTVAPWQALPQRNELRKQVDELEINKQQNPCRLISNKCSC